MTTTLYDGGMPNRTEPLASTRFLIWAFAPYIVISIVHVVVLAMGSPLAQPTKLLLMPLLALPVSLLATRLRPREVPILLLAALLLSWLGDGAGTFFPVDDELPLMLLFFGLAHIAYIVLFWRQLRERPWPWWALIYAAWWLGMLIFLAPWLGDLFVAVAIYGIVLGGTAALAARCHPVIAVGGAFFLISDTVLAVRLFRPELLPGWTSPLVMVTYTLGQGLIVAGALLALRQREPDPSIPRNPERG